MLNALVLLVLLGLIAFPAAVTTWALIEAERMDVLDTGEYEGDCNCRKESCDP